MNHFETRLKSGDNTFKELFRRYPYNPILMAKDWPYPVNVVLNPAAIIFGGKVLLLARVEDRRGFSHLTKAVSDDGISNWIIDRSPTMEPDPAHPEEAWGSLGVSLIDPDTGGYMDGLTPEGPNRNEGAESLVSWAISSLAWAEKSAEKEG